MKHTAIALTALLAAASAFAQGTINFATRVTGSIDYRAIYQGDSAPAGSTFWAQLYASAAGGTLAPIGAPVPFRDTPDAAKGYITAGGTVEVPGVPSGGTAQVQLYAWASSLGANYAEAAGKNLGGIGNSSVFNVTVGGGTLPPGALTGLGNGTSTLQISPIVPEPSIAALGLLGAGMLLIRRKK